MIKKIKKMMKDISSGILTLVLGIGLKILTVVAKFAKIGKFGLAAISMITYSYLFTWKFAVMIMVLLLIHEYGHIWAMKRCGLKTKGIYFIPFLGASAVTEEMFKNRRDEAYIAIMGPIFGLVLSGVTLATYMVTRDALFGAAAGWMAMVNLFNLLPIHPLDGGRIMKSIAFSVNSKWGFRFLIIGILLSMIIILWARIALFFFLLILGTLEFLVEYLTRNENMVIKRCIRNVDKIFEKDRPVRVQYAIDNVKRILTDENVDPVVRINTVIYIGKTLDDENSDIDYDTRGLSRAISSILERFDQMPRMTTRGIVITTIVYIGTAVTLWALMIYTSHIPEVEIARKFFMS